MEESPERTNLDQRSMTVIEACLTWGHLQKDGTLCCVRIRRLAGGSAAGCNAHSTISLKTLIFLKDEWINHAVQGCQPELVNQGMVEKNHALQPTSSITCMEIALSETLYWLKKKKKILYNQLWIINIFCSLFLYLTFII